MFITFFIQVTFFYVFLTLFYFYLNVYYIYGASRSMSQYYIRKRWVLAIAV